MSNTKTISKTRALALSFALAALGPCSSAARPEPVCPAPPSSDVVLNDMPGSFSVISMNTKNLPRFTNPGKDFIPDYINCQGSLASLYDIVLAQEMFDHDSKFNRKAGQPYIYDDKFSWVPSPVPFFDPGLSTLSKFEMSFRAQTSYKSCYGWYDNANDCLSQKGIQRVQIQTPGGVIEAFNTHLESSRSKPNQDVRLEQLKIHSAVLPNDRDVPVIIGGDYNFNEENKEPFKRWLLKEGFTIAVENRLDIIAYRGKGLRVIETEVIPMIDQKISDHNAVSARFVLAP